MVIGIDFDGTCVTHEFPEMGKDIGAVPVLCALINNGHKLVLNSMRPSKELKEAVEWFEKRGIKLYGVNKNPTQTYWTDSTKAYAHLYIDDSALGCPLKYNPLKSSRPYVDWEGVEKMLKDRGIIK